MIQSMLSALLLLVMAFLYISPILFMLIGSFKPESRVLSDANSIQALLPLSPSFDNYKDVFTRVPFITYMWNSLFITCSIIISGLLVNGLAGYSLARLQWRGRGIVLSVLLAIMILPLEAIVVPLFYQVSILGWRDTFSVQIVPFIANAFSIYMFYTFFLSFPREIEEAAKLDGVGVWTMFFRIIAPNSKPVFASVAILTFLTQWGAFLWPLMVTHSESVRPLPLAISTFYSLPPLQWGDIFAFGVMMVSPVLVVFLLFQPWFVRSVAASAIKG